MMYDISQKISIGLKLRHMKKKLCKSRKTCSYYTDKWIQGEISKINQGFKAAHTILLTQHLSASVTYIQLDWLYSIANITAYQWARKPVMSLSCDFTHFYWNYMQSTPDQNKVVFLALMMNAISPIGQIY